MIHRSRTIAPLKLRLHDELRQNVRQSQRGQQLDLGASEEGRAVEFCYVQSHHIKAVNALARRFFWPGIDGEKEGRKSLFLVPFAHYKCQDIILLLAILNDGHFQC